MARLRAAELQENQGRPTRRRPQQSPRHRLKTSLLRSRSSHRQICLRSQHHRPAPPRQRRRALPHPHPPRQRQLLARHRGQEGRHRARAAASPAAARSSKQRRAVQQPGGHQACYDTFRSKRERGRKKEGAEAMSQSFPVAWWRPGCGVCGLEVLHLPHGVIAGLDERAVVHRQAPRRGIRGRTSR